MIRNKANRRAVVPVSGKWFTLLLIVFALQGCIWVEDTSDLQQFVAEQRARPSGQIPPLPEYKPYEAFVYEGSALRDPFRPQVAEVVQIMDADTGIRPEDDRIKDYLESYGVDNLAMVGTISKINDEGLWALVKDTDGEVHRVTVGDYMGLDHGQVQSIDEQEIRLIEIVSNGRGGWMKRPRNIVLPEPK
ncbi:pilus assembly protein PilP [Nitrincola sp. MINF-07-Sa-05]|uniref:pilus assembly protein PilP n=1 Tax=Nitrincola salilacus TaxID=3400273 RepID=UPI0039184A65